MTESDILAEIRQIRDGRARECGYDVHALFQAWREETARLQTEGWTVLPANETASLVREETRSGPPLS